MNYFPSGTGPFRIDVKDYDEDTWHLALYSMGWDFRAWDCADIIPTSYQIQRVARFIKFTAVTYYGDGSGLDYFTIN